MEPTTGQFLPFRPVPWNRYERQLLERHLLRAGVRWRTTPEASFLRQHLYLVASADLEKASLVALRSDAAFSRLRRRQRLQEAPSPKGLAEYLIWLSSGGRWLALLAAVVLFLFFSSSNDGG